MTDVYSRLPDRTDSVESNNASDVNQLTENIGAVKDLVDAMVVTISIITEDTTIEDGSDNLLIFIDASSNTVDVTYPTLSANQNREIECVIIDATFLSRVIGEAAETIGVMNIIELPKEGNRVKSIGEDSEWRILVENITSYIRFDTYSHYGATDNRIEGFVNITESYGNGNLYSENHTGGYNAGAEGLEITINKPGRWAISRYNSRPTSGATYAGLSLNSSQLTTSIMSIAVADRLVVTSNPAGGYTSGVTWVGRLEVGDIIRPHDHTSTAINTPAQSGFTATYLGV